LQDRFIEEIKANHRIIRKVCLVYAHTRVDQEDLFQECLYNAWKAFPNFRNDAKFSTWLYRITYNTCISELRKRKVKFISTDEVQLDGESVEMSLEGLPEENREKCIKAAMGKLPEDEYTLVLLYYFDEQAVEEISKITGLTDSNVKVKLFRARKKLYAYIHEMMKDDLYTFY